MDLSGMKMRTEEAAAPGDVASGITRARLSRGELLLIAAFWGFMAVLTAANRLLDPRRPPGIQPSFPSAPVALAFAEALVWALATPFIFVLSHRFARERS